MIQGKNINLRLLRRDDLEKYVECTNDTHAPSDYYPLVVWTMSETERMFNEHGFFTDASGRMAITNKDDEMIGFVSYFKGSPYMNGYELGYKIFDTKDHGKGYTTEAVKLFTAFMFEHKPISRLQICMIDGHEGSARVAEKAGYSFEGIMRDVAKHRGKTISNRLYAITRPDVLTLEEMKASL
tara:strand:+ start:93 stop:641 length:549 start_codon:yes stop_codon:yes gene_type:complete